MENEDPNRLTDMGACQNDGPFLRGLIRGLI